MCRDILVSVIMSLRHRTVMSDQSIHSVLLDIYVDGNFNGLTESQYDGMIDHCFRKADQPDIKLNNKLVHS